MPESPNKNLVAAAHSTIVSGRRVRRLADIIAKLLSADLRTGLDIGCGSGEVAAQTMQLFPSLEITGVDTLVRPDALIPVCQYNGSTLPFADKHFDFSMLIDVLHHTNEPEKVLSEAKRVTRHCVIIKDHYCENSRDRIILSFMDWIGNKAYGVALPYNYQSRQQWEQLYSAGQFSKENIITDLDLYPFPFSLVFEKDLHFAARLNLKS